MDMNDVADCHTNAQGERNARLDDEVDRWKAFRAAVDERRRFFTASTVPTTADWAQAMDLGWTLDRIDEQLRGLGVDTDHG